MSLTFQFPDLQSFFWMNGHGPYVWGCYGVTFAALAFLLVEPILKRKRFVRQQQGLIQRKARSVGEE